MSSARRDSCRSCGAAVLWVKTERGKWQPLDLKTEKRVVLSADPDSTEITVARVVDVYVPHHMTCPQGKEWRL